MKHATLIHAKRLPAIVIFILAVATLYNAETSTLTGTMRVMAITGAVLLFITAAIAWKASSRAKAV